MNRRAITTLAVVLLLAVAVAVHAASLAVGKSDTLGTQLTRQLGKPVTLKLSYGDELTGVVAQVGDRVVYLEKIAGREFYDAVVDLDQVAAMLVRVR